MEKELDQMTMEELLDLRAKAYDRIRELKKVRTLLHTQPQRTPSSSLP